MEEGARTAPGKAGVFLKIRNGLAYYPLTFYFGIIFLIASVAFFWLSLGNGINFDLNSFLKWLNDHAAIFIGVAILILGMILIGSAVAYKQVSNLSKQDYVIWLQQRST